MNIVYMGTASIAAEGLAEILKLPFVSVQAVFTQPDAPAGRHKELTAPPVKMLALSQGLPVYQPVKIRHRKWVELLQELSPDLILVTAFGQILSEQILSIPKYGCINMHASLLPRYRGAAPIQWAIVNGETMTGVTTMMMDKGVDTGDMILQQKVPILDSDTETTMYQKLGREGARLLAGTVRLLQEQKTLPRTPQDPQEATYAPMIRKEDGLIDWNQSVRLVDCRVRGFSEWPGAYTYLEGKKITILEARPFTAPQNGGFSSSVPAGAEKGQTAACGQIFTAGTSKHPRLLVQCRDGLLEIRRLVAAGHKPMDAEAYLRGARTVPRRFDPQEGA